VATRSVPAHDAAGAETQAEIQQLCGGGVAIKPRNNPTGQLVMDRSAAYRLSMGVLAALDPDLWWYDRHKVSDLARYMLQGGWAHSEVVRAMEEPWEFTEVHHRASNGS
jgi:hypothetical protein